MATSAKLPRGPGIPIAGSTFHYFRKPLAFMDAASKVGDIVDLRFFHHRAFLINEPALIEQVLVKAPGSFHKDMFAHELKRVLGEGLLTSEGDFWKRQRRLIQPAFHRDRIAGYAKIMVEHTTRMLDRWRPGTTLDLHHEMMKLTSDIVAHALFGGDAADPSEVAWCIEAMMERFGDPIYLMLPILNKLPLPGNRKVREVRARLDAVVGEFIARGRARPKDAAGGDLLGMLLAARDEDGSRMTDLQVRDEILILFLAGHETTALALSWTFHLLANHPEVERALVEELATVLQGRAPTLEDLPKLRVAEQIVQETLRLYPPAWSLGRQAIEPFTLGGYPFQPGDWLWIIPFALHRDARWFSDPLAFRPARWADGLAKRLPKGAYLPFGAGPRICIGNQFAMMEAVLLLATIVQRFSLRHDAAAPPVEPDPSITLRFKHGLTMGVSAREANSSREALTACAP